MEELTMNVLFMRHYRRRKAEPGAAAPAAFRTAADSDGGNSGGSFRGNSEGGRLRCLAALLLCGLLICLLPACSPGEDAAAPAPAETAPADPADGQDHSGPAPAGDPATEEPAPVDPTAAAAREEFDAWCARFLKDQLGGSFLNLHYSLTAPEDYGITDYSIDFGDFSLAAMQEERAEQKVFQQELSQIDPSLLDDERKLTFQILEEAFRIEEAGDGLELYYQPLAPSNGVQAQLPVLLAEFTFRSRKDIDDYLTLLASIDTYYQQILEFEQEKAAAGLFMTDACADQIVEECAAYRLPADHNFMTFAFDRRVDAFTDLTDEERADYKARNLDVVEQHFTPAYQLLSDGLLSLKGSCTNPDGLCHYPDGKRYYEYLVASATGTNYSSMEALRDAIADRVDSDLAAMSDIIRNDPGVADEIDSYAFAYTDPEAILTHLETQIAGDFPDSVPCDYETKYVPDELAGTLGPAFFLVPPIDDYTSCVIYINPDSTSDSQSLYTTLAHEGIPGHMYQNTYFLSHCENDLRKVLSFTSYSEGWASYVENYSYTTDNGLPPGLGRLLARNASANLGLHALIDININYFGWTREQVREFLEPYFDMSEADLVDTIYNTMLNTPVNYLEYYVGYLEIMEMRETAEEHQGKNFSLKEFHRFLLDTGPAPFTVIRRQFQTWLLEESLNP